MNFTCAGGEGGSYRVEYDDRCTEVRGLHIRVGIWAQREGMTELRTMVDVREGGKELQSLVKQ